MLGENVSVVLGANEGLVQGTKEGTNFSFKDEELLGQTDETALGPEVGANDGTALIFTPVRTLTSAKDITLLLLVSFICTFT